MLAELSDKKSNMASQFITPSQALNRATEALQRGDKHAARTWAQIAASIAPNMEDPWLILAAVARPRASIAYLERALEINPQSKRARAGLEWAHQQQANEQTQSVKRKVQTSSARVGLPTQINPIAQRGKPSFQIPPKAVSGIRISIPILLLILALCLIAIWAVWPGVGSSVSAAFLSNPANSQDSHILSWLPVGLAKPTDTPLPTATSTPTVTPSPTLIPTETSSPTPTPTATSTFTATPVPTNTAQPSEGQESPVPQLPAGGKKLIVVSIHQQHLYAYQGNTLIYSFVASTGGNNSTRTGTFSILDKIPKAYGENWNFWMPDWMGIYHVGSMENGIHSLPLLPNGQRLWGDSIGTPITYGCVVLGVQDSQELYDWATVGTTVQINP
jgi:lipoprotein-anchoring transpeptidase ErfK/SrfK